MDIKAIRNRAGLTQQEAADLMGICRRTWINWEKGHTRTPPGAPELFASKAGAADDQQQNNGENNA